MTVKLTKDELNRIYAALRYRTDDDGNDPLLRKIEAALRAVS